MNAPADSVVVPVGDLRKLAAGVLAAVGVPEPHGALVVDGLLGADIEDQSSHGLLLLPMYVERILAGSVSASADGRIVSDTPTSIVIDADNALGQVTSTKAVALCVARSREHGTAAVAVRNGFHFGTAGAWARRIAEAGNLAMVMSNTRPLMPAPGGAERVVGNNPIAIAVPAAEGAAIVADVALSAGAMMKIRFAAANGEAIPDGWATDAEGRPTADAAQAINGMLLPAGGAKGFALAALIDLIAGGLSAGAIGDEVRPLYGDPALPYRCAHFFLAIDIARLRPLGAFTAAADNFAAKVRGSRRPPPNPPPQAGGGRGGVRMPGDRAVAARVERGERCPLPRSTLASLFALAKRFNVPVPAALTK
jgi:LDH2 family malate/lactate/ureidoglycolate dehydrogenase